MSRREDRRSESKRHRSRFDREPSPKRSRRDGKPETERLPTEPDLDKDRTDRDPRHHRRLQDPLPLESGTVNKESEKGADGHKGVAKHSSDQIKLPQLRSYFQHDDRASAGQNGRGFSRRTDSAIGGGYELEWLKGVLPARRNASINELIVIHYSLLCAQWVAICLKKSSSFITTIGGDQVVVFLAVAGLCPSGCSSRSARA